MAHYLMTLIYFIVIFHLELLTASASLIIEEDPGSEETHEKDPSLDKSNGGWHSTNERCRIVGYSCLGGWNSDKPGWNSYNGGWRLYGDGELSSDPGKGLVSGWGGNDGKCCNHDLCVNGKCCIPAPSGKDNSRCKKNEDCCSGGVCYQGQCLKDKGQSCKNSKECFQSECVDHKCCAKGCTNNTCTRQSDCCTVTGSNPICDMISNKCIVGLGDTCSCSSQCISASTCGLTGKCCVSDGVGPCTASSNCCGQSSGSICRFGICCVPGGAGPCTSSSNCCGKSSGYICSSGKCCVPDNSGPCTAATVTDCCGYFPGFTCIEAMCPASRLKGIQLYDGIMVSSGK